ncbi:quaternary amine ABC transporter ATP-binding protein [Nitriliruptor alkaliphilus]|uniref:quaternary amine ABC transporter ATP-binding protein n=1 Tax=Nitriliruptor alkaliphilus TaxID=427918 RepID=UPI000699156C|nr:glycine betaine/L-proline ABC transporter ATP-binding protein [Nitriliruptor alkaliphilus]
MPNDPDHGHEKVACEGLWKVFGPRPERVTDTPELAGLSRGELLERTGCVAAVRDVSFSVGVGELFVVMGLSGSGKSTLVRCLTRLIEPTAGRIVLDGRDVTAASPAELRELRRNLVSMVFQHFGLLPNRKVIDNVAYGLEIQGVDRARRRERAGDVIDLVGLTGFADRYPDELSGGMQQRVGLARALANDPEILLLDEPFSALDPLIRRDMQAEICRLQEQMGATMVFITHDLHEALRLGDRIAVMRDGDIVQIGTPAELLAAPADDYVADFTRDVPRALVLTAEDLCRPPFGGTSAPDATPATGEVDARTVLRDLIPRVADGRAVRVVRDGTVVGVVSRDLVLQAIYGGPLAELAR